MTDNGAEIVTINVATGGSLGKKDRAVQAKRAEIESRKAERDRDIRIYKSLINGKSRLLDVTPVQICRVLVSSNDVGDERALLGSVALMTLLGAGNPSETSAPLVEKCCNLDEAFLRAFDKSFEIGDLEWFKLVIIHGFLQACTRNVRSLDTHLMSLEMLRKHCLAYTKYSHIAYKILHAWMEKASTLNFWRDNDTSEMESKLESIIFSNWDNCTYEISRKNGTQIFSKYLKLMSEKYEGFLEYIYDNCVQNLSWQNVTKYAILLQICKATDNINMFAKSGLTSCIFTSLTKNHLKHAGTLLYLTILGKLRINEWESIFSQDFFRVSHHWESEKEMTAVELLWEQWMKPTIQKFPHLSEYLWKHPSMQKLKLSRTFLARTFDKRTSRHLCDDEFRKALSSQVVDITETIRMNAFAFICGINNWTEVVSEVEPFIDMKRFFYFNANPSTVYMRRGIAENFKIFLGNVMKSADADSLVDPHVRGLVRWLYEFLMDCFEIGSPYQRKILGLTLYGIILNFTYDARIDGVSAKATKYTATLKCANALKIRMIERDEWKFVSRDSAMTLLRLAVDPMIDVREKVAPILVRYFDPHKFTHQEKQVLITMARKRCNLARIYEDVRGTTLLRILLAWGIDEEDYVDYFLELATRQLNNMKKDLLKSASQGLSCFGALTAMREIAFTNEFANTDNCDDTVCKILDFIEQATNFFLSALSVKDGENEFSSSFAEMSVAIEATISSSTMKEKYEDCVLSPAHQLLLFCIWMSLKECCELAAEIGCHCDREETVERVANIIVTVLLKCRHKGAIEVAGLAVAKLTKSLCARNYDTVMKKHLSNLLNIDDSKDNINLTRRGAGLTIMFHRVVSSDDRNNRPYVHFAVARLLNSLKSTDFVPNGDCRRDLTCARHLHFLRSLIADKGLQGQLVRYMEDACMLCFRYLQSPEWTVRNASLQLFGAIVPRLVGQSSSRDLDYGIGYSVEHFVTHYPILAASVLDQLDEFSSIHEASKNIRLSDSPDVSKVVPILTLMSKMSTGGCDLIDYSSRDYVIRAKSIFTVLLGHPVFHVRGLAAKAYAAFVPLADVRHELTNMKMEKIDWYRDNYNHGHLLAQFYLERKYQYETRCTCDKYVIRGDKMYEKDFERAVVLQLTRAKCCWNDKLYTDEKPNDAPCTIHNLKRFSISAMLLNCLTDCPVASSVVRSNLDSFSHDFENNCLPVSIFPPSRIDAPPYPGLFDFAVSANAFKGQFLSCPFTRRYYMQHASDPRHHAIFKTNPKDLTDFDQLRYLLEFALTILHDFSNTNTLLHTLFAIVSILKSGKVNDTMIKCLIDLSRRLKSVDTGRPCAATLRNIGYIIALDATTVDQDLLNATIIHMYEQIYSEDSDLERTATKYSLIDCLERFVEKIFGSPANARVFYCASFTRRMDFIRIVIDLLTGEDAEMRELVADKLRALTGAIIGQAGNALCSRATLYKIIANSLTCRESILRMITLTTQLENIRSNETCIEDPLIRDNADQTYQRDDADLLNILHCCAKMLMNAGDRNFSEKERRDGRYDDIVELQRINGAFQAKHQLQNFDELDMKNVQDYLERISPSQYLRLKRLRLLRICDEEVLYDGVKLRASFC